MKPPSRLIQLARRVVLPAERLVLRAASGHDTLRICDTSPRWQAATEITDHLLQSDGWFALRSEQYVLAGTKRLLRLVDNDRTLADVAVRDLRLPGWGRWWLMMGEPTLTATDDASGASVTVAVAMNALADLARANGVRRLSCEGVMSDLRPDDLDPTTWRDARIWPKATFVVDLTTGPEARFAAMSKHHRRDARKGERLGVTISAGVDADAFIRLLDETYLRGGASHPFQPWYMRRLLTDSPVPTIIQSASLDGELQAAVLVVHDGHVGYYLHGVTASRPATGATIALHVAVMTELHGHGVQTYDMGGAVVGDADERLTRIATFKARFGGRRVERLNFRAELGC